MDNKSLIYWFSGTGNSLYAAKRLSDGLGKIPLYPMRADAPRGPVGGNGERVGFVFPSYYGNLPRMVRAFVEKLEILPGTYLFALVTMGGVGQGSVSALNEALNKKNLRLDYGRGILMPANYVINYNPADPHKSAARLERIGARIGRMASEIAAGKRSVTKLRLTSNDLYQDIAALDAGFFAENSCTGCGQCAKICPAANIAIQDGKPKWLGHCERCCACISWCPAQAIQYGARTKGRRRYRNPKIEAGELLL